MMIPAGALIALAIVAPWYIALYLQHGWTHISAFFIGENIGRFTETVGPQSRGLCFYLPVMLHDALPWSFCLPAVVVAWWREWRHGQRSIELRLRTLLLLWIGMIVGLFSFSQTKQDLYIFPIVGAIAVLGGVWLARALEGGQSSGRPSGRPAFEPWLRGTLTVLGLALLLLGLSVMTIFGGEGTPYVTEGAYTSALIAIAGSLIVTAAPWWRRYRVSVAAALTVFIALQLDTGGARASRVRALQAGRAAGRPHFPPGGTGRRRGSLRRLAAQHGVLSAAAHRHRVRP